MDFSAKAKILICSKYEVNFVFSLTTMKRTILLYMYRGYLFGLILIFISAKFKLKI